MLKRSLFRLDFPKPARAKTKDLRDSGADAHETHTTDVGLGPVADRWLATAEPTGASPTP